MPEDIKRVSLPGPSGDVSLGTAAMLGTKVEPIKGGDLVAFDCNESPAKDSWRLVHNGKAVLALFSSPGITRTRNDLFCGTEEECNAEIKALALDRTAFDSASGVGPTSGALSDAEIVAAVKADPAVLRRISRAKAMTGLGVKSSASIGLKLLVLVLLVINVCGAPREFYVDFTAGSDSNNGLSHGAAWKRQPYMNGFAGSYTHAGGDRFVFKGGETWPVTCFQMAITGSGTSDSVRDFYGADEAWFTGGAFARPLFDFQDTLLSPTGFSAGAGINVTGGNITFDNLEMARHRAPLVNPPNTNSYGCVTLLLNGTPSNITITNCVIRDWSIPTPVPFGGDGGGGGGVCFINSGGGLNFLISHCVFNQSMAGVKSGISANLFAVHEWNEYYDTPNGIIGGGTIRNNHIHDIVNPDDSFTHPNAIETFAPTSTYNNLIHDLESGAAAIYHIPDWSGGSGIDLIYNNVVYNCGNQAAIQIDTGGANPLLIGARCFNNTLVHLNICIRLVERGDGPYGLLDVRNNQLITSGTPVGYDNPGLGWGDVIDFTYSSNVVQTAAVAAAAGFTSANDYYPTIGAPGIGIDLSSYFTTDLLGVTRTVPWSVGAYQYAQALRILHAKKVHAGHIHAAH